MPRPVDPRQSFPALEMHVLERWRERSVFQETLHRRRDASRWVFYEAPPTVNGPPGFHHTVTRALKDVFLRHRTMSGYLVERKAGWDCHGLPVEITVEQQLGFRGKDDIDSYGVAEFNQRCRELVLRHIEDWNRFTERVGCWMDLDGAYITHDPDYVQSVWWALRVMWDRGLLYEGHKVVPYCTRCGTTLSSHELGQPGVYRDVVEPSVFVRLPVTEAQSPLRPGDELLVWTTTPWTLVSNAAVAVDPELRYVRVATGDSVVVVAEAALERVFGGTAVSVLDAFPGQAIVATPYRAPFPFLPRDVHGPTGHTVLPADFVQADEGTGLVHIALAFGEDDFRLGTRHRLRVVNPVRPDGRYDERIGRYAGRPARDANDDLLDDLRRAGRLLRADTLAHPRPHCWRCDSPLVYYAKPNWFIRTSAFRDRLLAVNEQMTWHPEYVKAKRFGSWLAGNVDWALASVTGGRRCPSGAVAPATPPAWARLMSSQSSPACGCKIPTARMSTTYALLAVSAAGR